MQPKNIRCSPGHTALRHEIKEIDPRTSDDKAAIEGCEGKQHLQKRPHPSVKVDFREVKSGPAARRVSHPVHPDVHEPDPVEGHGYAETESDESPDFAGAVIGECAVRDHFAVGGVSSTTRGSDAGCAELDEEPDFDGVELRWGPRKGDVEECDEDSELEA